MFKPVTLQIHELDWVIHIMLGGGDDNELINCIQFLKDKREQK